MGPTPTLNQPSPTHHPTPLHHIPERWSTTGHSPARLLDPAATYNTTLTALRSTHRQLALGLALLTERSSRRHTRSPGEAGGGRSDLCHDNDETDPVNRRARVGDNLVDPTTELLGGERRLLELRRIELPSRNEELAADREQGKSKFGDDGEWAERPRRCDIERRSRWTSGIVLESRVDHRDVGEAEGLGSRLHPVQATSLGVDHGEGCCPMGNCQRQAWQPGTRPEVGPALSWRWCSNPR